MEPICQKVELLRGGHGDPNALFGPLPGVRYGNVVAYEMELPERFVPRPSCTWVERIFVLLDLGVSFANPVWFQGEEANTWYVDLVSVAQAENRYIFRDLYLDVMAPVDGRHQRLLDLDDFAEALADGSLAPEEAADGLRRWQHFLDRHLHAEKMPVATWSDFPPASILPLLELPTPLGEPVRWQG